MGLGSGFGCLSTLYALPGTGKAIEGGLTEQGGWTVWRECFSDAETSLDPVADKIALALRIPDGSRTQSGL